MTVVNIKNINFSGSSYNLETTAFDFSGIDSVSMESIAYTIRWQLSKRRSGSASTKLMSEISGTTAKPYKQKGTGRARQGSKRSVQFRGGRVCFGPRPRSYDFKMPKKIVRSSIYDVLKLKVNQNKLIIFNGSPDNIKTSELYAVFEKNGIDSVLLLSKSSSDSLVRSVRNIKNAKTINRDFINVYDMLRFDFVMLDNEYFENIKGFL